MTQSTQLRHKNYRHSKKRQVGRHSERSEEESEGKNGNAQTAGFIKTPVFKGVASSRFLPKGTKTKVNLEDQGRQKVSFSFSSTKKTLQTRFLTALGNEKQQNETQNSSNPVIHTTDHISKIKTDLTETINVSDEPSPPKPKVELSKIHFKKHLLSVTSKLPTVTVIPAAVTSSPPPPPPPPAVQLSPPILPKEKASTSPPKVATVVASPPPSPPPPPPPPPPERVASPPPQQLTVISISSTPPLEITGENSIAVKVLSPQQSSNSTEPESSEDVKVDSSANISEEPVLQKTSECTNISQEKDDSHIGKEEDLLDNSKNVSSCVEKQSSKIKSSHPDGIILGSESDGDSIQTSSSHRSHELKNSASAEKDKDLKKSSTYSRNVDHGKSATRSKSERDDKRSGYSKSDRDTHYTTSRSRSDRDRRRSRSRSRSRSDRSSRTSSTYSRSERSHYYEYDRRYHRSSPYRERTRYSRSYADSRTRDSSDSEEEHRRTHSRFSDLRHTSSYTSSYRDSRMSSYSKSDRDNKTESYYTESEKRGRSSKSEKECKKISELEVTKKSSPLKEMLSKTGSSRAKTDSNMNSSLSKSSKPVAGKCDKIKSSVCSDSDEDIKQSSYTDVKMACKLKNEELDIILSQIQGKKKAADSSYSTPVKNMPSCKNIKDELKESASCSRSEEIVGNHDYDDAGKAEMVLNVKCDQIKCSTELNISKSPEKIRPLVPFYESDTEDVYSDDACDLSSLSPVSQVNKSHTLSANEVKNICESKDDKDKSAMKSDELHISIDDAEKDSCPFFSAGKETLVEQSEGLQITHNETKDSDQSYATDNTKPLLYDSAAEIAIECTIVECAGMEATPEIFRGIEEEPQCILHEHRTSEEFNPSETVQNEEQCIEINLESTNSSSHLECPELQSKNSPFNVEWSSQIKFETEVLSQSSECISTNLDIVKTKNESVEQTELELTPELELQTVQPYLESEKSPFGLIELFQHEEKTEEDLKEEKKLVDISILPPETVGEQPTEYSVIENTKSTDTPCISNVSPSLCCVVPSENTEVIILEPKCDSSGNASEHISAIDEDYSDSVSEQESDRSDTDDSDSDDSSVPRNRLHSVVVVPKNSTLMMEETSPCSSQSSQSSQKQSVPCEDENIESSKSSHEGKIEHTAYTNSECSDKKLHSPSKELNKSPETSSVEPNRKKDEDLEPDCHQSQSDGVDSTSQSDPNIDTDRKPILDDNIVAKRMQACDRPLNEHHEEQPVCPNNNNHGTSNKSQQQLPSSTDKTDSIQGESGPSSRDGGEFSKTDGFHSTEDLGNLGWDFSQPEKPSSTYQQPDSSYCTYSAYGYQQHGSEHYDSSNNYWKNNGYWDPKSHKFSKFGYDRMQGQMPDSLTDYYDEYDDDHYNWEDECRRNQTSQSNKLHSQDPREKGSVQAPEISSNSIKEPAIANEKESERLVMNKNDMQERAPPKKRSQDLESESESDGDSRNRKKLKTEGLQLESIPSETMRTGSLCIMGDFRDPQHWKDYSKQGKMPPYFDLIEENVYLTERKKNKTHRDIKRMQCECSLLSKEERAQGAVACGEDCLNRLLMIECSSRCPNGEYCSNRRFQKKQHADVEVILTEQKGWGLRAAKELPPNTFVLEYCGEVLDHKEFKARVKEYARSKNIHYYFMALKNDEIIDATQKGNCSRFMNHSCEPNCETQKWTVNGQLRVGFFTTRLVPASSELTFDYQFQRYGKEAQKCFCGSANCRGYLGGENRVSIRAAGGKMKKERSRKKDSVDGELEALLENGEGLSDKNQVLILSRLMVRIETLEQKLTCLKLIQNTHSQSCLKFFLECHGLSLLWIWMAELGDGRGNSINNLKLQLEIIKTLGLLPIQTKNMLEESKVLPIIQRWAQTKSAVPQLSEGDGYSSENTSRAQTPLNTLDPTVKLSVEVDGETPKKLVFRRLKIISENSMDSAISDTMSEQEGKECKEEVENQEPSPTVIVKEPHMPQTPVLVTSVEAEAPADTSKPQAVETEAEQPEAETKENNGSKLEESLAVETPSQDEEEGISDVESERSQEPGDKMIDMSDLAIKLLENWKDLKEVYRIPKKSQAEKESSDRGKDTSGQRDQASNLNRERDLERQIQNKEKRKRKQSLSPPPSAYERGTKRTDERGRFLSRSSSDPDPAHLKANGMEIERYDTPTSSKKKVRIKDRNKLSTEERRKLFEQEVAQREAQKQQQQMQSLGISSPIPYESLGYGNHHHTYMGYPPGYPIQSFVDPSNPNAGKVLLPTPPLDPICSPASYDHPQTALVPHSGEATMDTPQPVPVVQHVAPTMDVSAQQYVTQSKTGAPQEPSVAMLPVPAPAPVQSYGVWDPSQQPVAVQPQPQYSPAHSQTAMYYQGQACQTVYNVTTSYAQTAQPVVQNYPQQGLQYIQGQQIYPSHPQGVAVQQTPAVTAVVTPGQPPPLQQPELVAANNLLDLPPPSPPKPKTIVLPPSWKTARDPEGKIYYYHVVTRQTQWDPPAWDSPVDDGSVEHEAEMDLGTPTYDENPMKSSQKPKTAEADTSSELAKKSKEVFRKEMSQFIVQCLNPYRKPDCKIGRITTTEDFKHLARKLTHGVMNKELKYCKNPEDLECNENVKHKTKEYIKKYMQKFGTVYRPKEDMDME
uniref:[histone H3]-lysine(36) N-trimethyltransferase n=1 Tax=Geotrypetes seraphini TaxID=260995 RepID=A0A6P8QJU7_GEOSA|nr:histone-lysine N-methyltransferase SETD2 isoform X2 [Geotrypetes seraphini]